MAISSILLDTVSLLKGMDLTISRALWCITVEITSVIAGRISVSPILCGFPYFAINLEMLYDATSPSLFLLLPFLNISETGFCLMALSFKCSKNAMSLLT